MNNKPEILAPAGQPEAGYAALHYGADAVYLGLNRFSARAEAVNFTPDELASFVAHAHSLTPCRKVYLTLNTLVQERELAGAVETLGIAADCGVDAVIVQDFGVLRLVRENFPGLPIHASTQMAIHNLAGAVMARRLGCSRVTLARELTLEEIGAVTGESGLEVEVFIHGTLCYAYSGLCLFSSITTGRSGNRGRCVYSCREAVHGAGAVTHPFSLKDLALGPRVLDLARAGVSSLKIEGRKKSPLYVAATVDYYRKLVDGQLTGDDGRILADRLKTIFARPWTTFFLDGKHNPDAADTDVVGHRGAPLGTLEGVAGTPAGTGVLLTPRLPVERHDGLQIDIPGQSRPYGFAIDDLFSMTGRTPKSVFASSAGERIAVALPPDAPALPPGLKVYLSSSQEVKRSYPFPKPRSGGFGRMLDCCLTVTVTPAPEDGFCSIAANVVAELPAEFGGNATITVEGMEKVPCFPAREPGGPHQAAVAAFSRTGGSRFRLNLQAFQNDAGLFVKPGDWNRLRREILSRLEDEYAAKRVSMMNQIVASLDAAKTEHVGNKNFFRSLCVDRVADLSSFNADDFSTAAEVIVGIEPEDPEIYLNALEELTARCDRKKIRLGVPLILRSPEMEKTRTLLERLEKDGWQRWFVSNPGGFELVAGRGGDVSADWPLHVLNSQAAESLLSLGCTSFTLSPEDDSRNIRRLTARYGEKSWVVVYSELPLFISAACAHSHLGLCRGEVACREGDKTLSFTLERSGNVFVQPLFCGSIVTGETPFSLTDRLDMLNNIGVRNLRIDLRWRVRTPLENVAVWRGAFSNQNFSGVVGNFERGLV